MPRPLIERSFGRSGSGLLMLRLKKRLQIATLCLLSLSSCIVVPVSAKEDCQYHDENYLLYDGICALSSTFDCSDDAEPEQCENFRIQMCLLEYVSKENCNKKSTLPLSGGFSP